MTDDSDEVARLKKLLQEDEETIKTMNEEKETGQDLEKKYSTVSGVLGEPIKSEKSGRTLLAFKQKNAEIPSNTKYRTIDETYSKLFRNEEKVQEQKMELLLKDAQLQGVENFANKFAKSVSAKVLHISKLQGRMFRQIEQENKTRNLVKNWGPIVTLGLFVFGIIQLNSNPALKQGLQNFLSDQIDMLALVIGGVLVLIVYLRYRSNKKKNNVGPTN